MAGAGRYLGGRAIISPVSEPVTIVQLSDLHLREGPDGAGAAARLARAVRLLAELQPRPLAILLSGDLADEPSPSAYRQAHDLLAPLGLPLHAIPGNHDDRDMLRARFGPAGAAEGSRVCFSAAAGSLRLIGLDSTIPASAGGALGEEQLAWLEQTLAAAPEQPTLLALHHPPVASGIAAMDAIALDGRDSERLESVLEGHRQVLAVTCGHVHTTMATSFAGRLLLICPGTSSAIRLDLRADDAIPFATTGRPVGFAVHALIGGRLVTHVQPFEQPEP
jgi:3',5'-cyclic AMP phosphodiesterase CpdA